MEKFAVWVVAGLLAYICLVLTSISGKLDEIGVSNGDVTAVNEVKSQNSDLKEPRISLYREAQASGGIPTQTIIIVASLIGVFISWHLSRIYHNHQWTKRLLRKTYAHYDRSYPIPEPAELHPDQDCVGDPPPPDGRIKDSWLPAHVHEYRYRMRLTRPRR